MVVIKFPSHSKCSTAFTTKLPTSPATPSWKPVSQTAPGGRPSSLRFFKLDHQLKCSSGGRRNKSAGQNCSTAGLDLFAATTPSEIGNLVMVPNSESGLRATLQNLRRIS